MSGLSRKRLAKALAAAGAQRESDALFDELARRYAEPQRHYHDASHIAACLAWLDRCLLTEPNQPAEPAEVELALWFHDAVYDPRASDNETQSAELARNRLTDLAVPKERIARIARCIEATKAHDAAAGDAARVVDIDLSILGAPAEEFARFEQQIRAEYTHVPDELFRVGRRHVLEAFASRAPLYRTPLLHDELEASKQRNLTRRIAELSD
jgi:predicted metal-dependent HD superfamily phosphohydrolase